jgi:hypothetical protein
MKTTILALVLVFTLNATLTASGQQGTPAPTLRSVLLEQLRSTHNKSDWLCAAMSHSQTLRRSRRTGPTAKAITRWPNWRLILSSGTPAH